jgi:2-methylcitrate dehydratase PrpD
MSRSSGGKKDMAVKNQGPTITLADFVSQFKFDDIPSEVVEHTKRVVLDFIGVSLSGSRMENSRIISNMVKEWGGLAESSVIGFPFKLPAPSAGLLNGAIGHAVQMDDTEWVTVAHLGTEVIPAALAVAERQGDVDGKEFLKAVVLGFEGAIRIGASINPTHHHRGFSPNGTLGVFGAAISAGSILNLEPLQMADAIGSAAMQSSGLEEFCYDGSMSAILNTGHATQAGIISALLAERGFTGSRTILEGKSGFCRAYSDDYDISKITEGLGEEFAIVDVWFKRYPTCAYCNSALDIVLDLKENNNLTSDDINSVKVKTFSTVENTINNPDPDNVTAAMLSLPYSIAMAIHQGKVTQEEFKDDWLSSPQVRNLMSRVDLVIADEELTQMGLEFDRGAVVQIISNDGIMYEGSAKAAKGDPVYPLTDEELKNKYQILAAQVLKAELVDEIESIIWEVEYLNRIEELTKLLRINPNFT